MCDVDYAKRENPRWLSVQMGATLNCITGSQTDYLSVPVTC